jgi:HD-like signal output (HDOD) protein
LLFDIGNDDLEDVLLIEGEVELSSKDGTTLHVRAGTDAARLPLARLRPRRYRGKAVDDVRYLRVPEGAVARVLDGHDSASPVTGYQVNELLHGEPIEAQELFVGFVKAVREDAIRLPSLPDVAAKVRTALANAELGAEELAKIVGRDASIAAKIVRVANSPLYRGEQASRSVVDAVSRIGIDRAQQLVMGFALKELFKSHVPQLAKRMSVAWQHSQWIASAAFLLARRSNACGPERALLCGLVHDIGVVALLAHAEQVPRIWRDPASLERVLAGLKSEAGALMLERWAFDSTLRALVQNVDDWRANVSIEGAMLQAVHWSRQRLDGGLLALPASFARLAPLTAEDVLAVATEADEMNSVFDDSGRHV